jgi:predicted SAM-dependent methyltransferase
MKILDVGAGKTPVEKANAEDEVFTVDLNPENEPDLVWDIRNPFPEEHLNQYDLVTASHVLEHIPRLQVLPTVVNLRNCLKDGGTLYIGVPSMEWVAGELLREKPSNAVIHVIYGMDEPVYQQHRCGFTLMMLRNIVELAGMVPRRATQTPLKIHMDGFDYQTTQNIVVAMRSMDFEKAYDKRRDPAEALG